MVRPKMPLLFRAKHGLTRALDGRHSLTGSRRMKAIITSLALCLAIVSRADDWPQWGGPHRDGVWRETGILESFPTNGLKVLWRFPVGTGFSSPVVAQGRVYVTDSHVTRTNARENVRCLDASTGKPLWTHTYD